MGLDRPRSLAALGFKCLLGRRVQLSVEREVGEPLLSNVWVLVFLVGAESVQPLCSENADDGAEDVGLLDVNVDEVSGFLFDVLDCLFDVNRL